MQTALRKDRDVAVDFIKAFAILGVVLIHVSTGAYANPVGSFPWYSAVLWGSVSRASVPLFLMCTGVLFLGPERELSGKKLWLRYILRLLAALFVWAAVYKVYHLVDTNTVSPSTLLAAGKELVLFQHESHLYYLHIVLLVYAFLPLTRLLTCRGSKRLVEYFLLLWFALGIFYPTVIHFWPFRLLSGIPLQWRMNMTWAAIGYGVLGYYLKRYPIKKRWAVASLAVGFAMVFGLTVRFSLNKGVLDTQFWEGMSVGVCLMAAGIFALFYALPASSVPACLTSGARFLAKASFCVYLCHMLFLSIFRNLGMDANWPTPLVGIPLLAGLTFLASLLVYGILSKIPGVKHWLI